MRRVRVLSIRPRGLAVGRPERHANAPAPMSAWRVRRRRDDRGRSEPVSNAPSRLGRQGAPGEVVGGADGRQPRGPAGSPHGGGPLPPPEPAAGAEGGRGRGRSFIHPVHARCLPPVARTPAAIAGPGLRKGPGTRRRHPFIAGMEGSAHRPRSLLRCVPRMRGPGAAGTRHRSSIPRISASSRPVCIPTMHRRLRRARTAFPPCIAGSDGSRPDGDTPADTPHGYRRRPAESPCGPPPGGAILTTPRRRDARG